MADRNLVLQLLITAKDQASGALKQVVAGVKGVGAGVSAALEPLRNFGTLLAAAAGLGGGKELIDRADAYTRLTNSLKVATSSEQDYQAALKDVAAIASRTNADIEVTAQLYGKVTQSAKELGISQTQVGQLTEVISKGMQLSGASAESASGAIMQLTQAFGSGALRSEEFNSVIEASPELLRFLATGLGVTIGELRGLAEQGALTSRAVSAALLAQKDAIDKAYGETTRTVGQAFTNLNNQLILYVGKVNESTGVTATIGATLKLLADNLNVVAAAAGAGLVGALGKSTQALISYARESIAARAAARDHAIAAAAQREAALSSAQANLAAAQAAVNRAIAEQRSALALQAGIEKTFGLVAGEQALTAARARSAAAAQAATAATVRYAEANAATQAAQAAMTTGTGLLARAMGFLAGPGGWILLAVSAFGLLLPILSKNKTATDNLTVSTDDYRKSLNTLNSVQLRGKMVEINQAIIDQESVVKDAAYQIGVYQRALAGLTPGSVYAKEITDKLTLAQAALATEEQKLSGIKEKLKIVQDALVISTQQITSEQGKQFVQYQQIKLAMQNYTKDLDALGKQQKAVASANEERIQAELELAKATGDVQAVDRLTLELATARATTAQQQAELDRAAAVAANLKLNAAQQEYDLLLQKQPKDEENLRIAKQDAELKNAQAAASGALAARLQQQANETDALTQQIARLTAERLAEIDASATLLKVQSDEAQQSAKIAIFKGNEYEARQNLIRVAEIEVDLARLSSERKTIEAAATVEVVKEIQREIERKIAAKEAITAADRARLISATNAMNVAAIEAEAAGKVAEAEILKANAVKLGTVAQNETTGQTQQHTNAVKENTSANQENVKVIDNVGKLLQSVQSYYEKSRTAMEGLSEATRQYYDLQFSLALSLQGVEGSYEIAMEQNRAWLAGMDEGSATIAKYREELELAWDSIEQGNQAMLFANNFFAQWGAAVDIATGKAKAAFYEQAIQAENYRQKLEELAESGTGDLFWIQTATNAVKNEFNLLDEEDLSGLQSALDDANDKIREMQEEAQDAQSALKDLQATLLEEQGREYEASLLRQANDYEEDRLEIIEKRHAAEAVGNRALVDTYNEQLSVLEKINTAKVNNIKTDQSESNDAATKKMNALATATEKAANATKTLATTDLSGLVNQTSVLSSNVQTLGSLL